MILFFVVLLFRLYFSFSVAPFSDDTSYFHLKNIEHIKENIFPMTYDELSYGGRPVLFNWIFHYFLIIFSFIPFYLKIIPQLLMSLTVILVYILSKFLVKDEKSALFAAFISGFIPLIIRETINKISIYNLVIPLILYLIYCFMNIKNRRFLIQFLLLFIFLSILHPFSIIFSLALLLYLLVKYTEDKNIRKNEIKLALISFLIAIIINLMIFYEAIMLYGIEILWRNIPESLYVNTFNQLNIFSLILGLGYITIILGIPGIYYGFRKVKLDIVYMMSSLLLIISIFLSFNVLDFYTSLMFIGILTSVFASLAITIFVKYLKITKLEKYKSYFFTGLFFAIILLSFYPSMDIAQVQLENTITQNEVDALKWIKEDSEGEDVIFGSLYEGHSINYFSGKKNFYDTNFFLAPRPALRLLESDAMINLESSEMALRLYKKNNIKYIFFSDKFKRFNGIEELKYDNLSCFEKHDFVYKIVC